MKKKNNFLVYSLAIMGLFLSITISCKKDDNKSNTTPQSLQVPVLTTSTVSGITLTTATCGGNITSDGGAAVTSRGVCWSTNLNPTTSDSKTIDGTGTGVFTSNITGLTGNTIYYLRAYATNSVGTSYGSEITFGTEGTVTDIDGNIYHTVTIGTQIWMLENLKVTKYNNGTSIPLVTADNSWSSLTTSGYCWYNNDYASNGSVYGALYNWYAVNTGNLCPTGWHVPTDTELTTLTNYLGGISVTGGKLKETGTTHWNTPNSDATNTSGFTGLPGGYRSGSSGIFGNIGRFGNWWSSTEANSVSSLDMGLAYNDGILGRYGDIKKIGYSVRCIKN
jgi:uncharacterized protein (TIGR02145 family)